MQIDLSLNHYNSHPKSVWMHRINLYEITGEKNKIRQKKPCLRLIVKQIYFSLHKRRFSIIFYCYHPIHRWKFPFTWKNVPLIVEWIEPNPIAPHKKYPYFIAYCNNNLRIFAKTYFSYEEKYRMGEKLNLKICNKGRLHPFRCRWKDWAKRGDFPYLIMEIFVTAWNTTTIVLLQE